MPTDLIVTTSLLGAILITGIVLVAVLVRKKPKENSKVSNDLPESPSIVPIRMEFLEQLLSHLIGLEHPDQPESAPTTKEPINLADEDKMAWQEPGMVRFPTLEEVMRRELQEAEQEVLNYQKKLDLAQTPDQYLDDLEESFLSAFDAKGSTAFENYPQETPPESM